MTLVIYRVTTTDGRTADVGIYGLHLVGLDRDAVARLQLQPPRPGEVCGPSKLINDLVIARRS